MHSQLCNSQFVLGDTPPMRDEILHEGIRECNWGFQGEPPDPSSHPGVDDPPARALHVRPVCPPKKGLRRAPPEGFATFAHGLGNRCSIPLATGATDTSCPNQEGACHVSLSAEDSSVGAPDPGASFRHRSSRHPCRSRPLHRQSRRTESVENEKLEKPKEYRKAATLAPTTRTVRSRCWRWCESAKLRAKVAV